MKAPVKAIYLSIVFALATLALPRLGLGYEVLGHAWPEAETEIHIDLDAEWETAFAESADLWNQLAPFTFQVVVDSPKDPCDDPNVVAPRNGAVFSSTICGTAFGATALAVTSTWVTDSGATPLQSGIWYNTSFTWGVYAGPNEGPGYEGVYDFRRATLHELGHVLGLAHEEDVPSIMHELISDIESPTADDVEGVREIYLGPRIRSVSPNPVTGSDTEQTFIILGENFSAQPDVTLRQLDTGATYSNRPIVSGTEDRIELSVNFSSETANWSVQVANDDHRLSNEFEFAVFDPAESDPDLVVEEVTVTPSQGEPEDPITIEFVLHNQGTASAEPHTTNVRLGASSDSVSSVDPLLASVPLPELPVGYSLTVTLDYAVPTVTAGQYYVWVIADVDSTAGQANEGNDTLSTPLSVVGGAPDLVIHDLRVEPPTVDQGGSATVDFTLRNQGTGPALASTTRLRASTPGSPPSTDDPLLGSVEHGGLAADAETSVSRLIQIPFLAAGEYRLWAIADADTSAGQVDEENDYASVPLTVDSTSSQFAWPLATPLMTQEYACVGELGCYSNVGHHAGVDLRAQSTVPVASIGAGRVSKVCLIEEEAYPNAECSVSSEADCVNNFLGNVVVVQHAPALYSLYAHLSSVSQNTDGTNFSCVGDSVLPGDRIGLTGGSGGVDPHLHLEVKNNDDLLAESAGNVYTPHHPNEYGYIDPWSVLSGIEPVAVRSATPESIEIRRQPRHSCASNPRECAAFLSGGAEQFFVAYAQHTKDGSQWYKIHVPCGTNDTCVGWIDGDGVATAGMRALVSVQSGAAFEVPLRPAPDNQTVLGYAYQDQQFVLRDSQVGPGCDSSWLGVDIPDADSPVAWICGDLAQLPSGATYEDLDGDSVLNDEDNCPYTYNSDQANADPDAEGNACDPDDDNDGLTDAAEVDLGTDPLNPDSDSDSMPDGFEIDHGLNPLDGSDCPSWYCVDTGPAPWLRFLQLFQPSLED